MLAAAAFVLRRRSMLVVRRRAVLIARLGWTEIEVTGANWQALQDAAHISTRLPDWSAAALAALVTFGWMLPATGPAQTVVSVASNLPQPRVPALRRTLLLAAAASIAIAIATTFAYHGLLPAAEQPFWADMPLIAVARQMPQRRVPTR